MFLSPTSNFILTFYFKIELFYVVLYVLPVEILSYSICNLTWLLVSLPVDSFL